MNEIGHPEKFERATEVNVMVFEWQLQDEADVKAKGTDVSLERVCGGAESCKGQTGFEVFDRGLRVNADPRVWGGARCIEVTREERWFRFPELVRARPLLGWNPAQNLEGRKSLN